MELLAVELLPIFSLHRMAAPSIKMEMRWISKSTVSLILQPLELCPFLELSFWPWFILLLGYWKNNINYSWLSFPLSQLMPSFGDLMVVPRLWGGINVPTCRLLDLVSYCLALWPYQFLEVLWPSPTSLPHLGHRTHCQGHLLFYIPRNSTQPFLSLSLPANQGLLLGVYCLISHWGLCLFYLRREAWEREEFFRGLCKSLFLLVLWPRYFVFASAPSSSFPWAYTFETQRPERLAEYLFSGLATYLPWDTPQSYYFGGSVGVKVRG